MVDDKHQTVPVRLALCVVVIGVAAMFVLPLLAVRNSITTLHCLYAAPWWRTGELTYWAAAWTGGDGWLSCCRMISEEQEEQFDLNMQQRETGDKS